MILGFIEASPESSAAPTLSPLQLTSSLGRTKRKATTSLAVYDIELLKAWYTSPRVKAGSSSPSCGNFVNVHTIKMRRSWSLYFTNLSSSNPVLFKIYSTYAGKHDPKYLTRTCSMAVV